MSQTAVADPTAVADSSSGSESGESDGDGPPSTRSTASAKTVGSSISHSIGRSCPSKDITVKPSPEEPWQVAADDADTTDRRGGASYVVLSGNWGHLVKTHFTKHRNKDLLQEPCHILALQEADEDLWRTLTAEASSSEQSTELSGEDRQKRRYIAVLGKLGPKDNTTLLCAVRTSLFTRIIRSMERRKKKAKEKIR